ncbi:MAG: 16S rRNA (adenine(1518)-N(6)/adenine(1519)-N(6))-dimethyltransferase RsmA [Thermodesulfobacteriota bacterium]|nr:16S rRNA (adenine(1518)-N(6)/adenine(1519)-N(6))-dimethyltransferase RsmA [Thermodesulfobacteriota bacterium]
MASIRNELREYGLSPKKRLGQHFLVDRNILDKVIRTAEVNKKDVVLEVGPGLGEMTLGLARRAKRVIAVEIDSTLVEILKKKMSTVSNVEIIKEDILKVDFDALSRHAEAPLKVVANLPYQISTPLLFRFIESRRFFSSLTLMLQKEVVERMIAPAGVKTYGALSIFVQMVSHPSIHFFISPSAFFPRPKVESTVVHLVWREEPWIEPDDEKWFKEVVKASFSHRRKTLINSLKHSGLPLPLLIEERMKATGIDPRRRPETLSIKEFIHLSEVLKPI